MDEKVNDRKMGIRKLETCINLPVKVTVESTAKAAEAVDNSTNKEEEKEAVTNALDNLAEEQAKFSQNPVDKINIKGNFFVEMLEKFVKMIMSIVISPKFITLFAINHQIIYGQGEGYADAKDFMRKNSTLVNNIKKILRDIILAVLLKAVLKFLSSKLAQKFIDDEIEKGKIELAALLLAIGIPGFIIAKINDL